MNNTEETILILGAGTGGIAAAHELSKKFGKKHGSRPVKIILFEKEENNVFAPSLLWLMVGKRKPKQIYRKTSKLAGHGIELVTGNIEKIDPANISVTTNGKTYQGSYMIVSLGVNQAPECELNLWGHDFYSLEGASNFHDAIRNFKGGKIAILVPSLPFKCPAAPYEAAMLVEAFIRKEKLREKTEISLYSPESGPLPVAGKQLSDGVRQIMGMKGIQYHSDHQLMSATERTLTFSNGSTFEYDLLAYTPKHSCPSVISETALIGKSGWIEVNGSTMETNFQNVYAIGDNTFIPLHVGKPLPKAGVFAHKQAITVAQNISKKISGEKPDKTFNGEGQCFLELGDGKAGYAGGNFYAFPAPEVKMKSPGFLWHWVKIWFEKYWFYKHFR
ncbi:MAG: NAD(P)/FAD-dependent oxidoreductase [Bacteroidetes bacterium]|nr:NAD(P)/FAD-dependent oxidoreductase [Bacteroidota bacterium]